MTITTERIAETYAEMRNATMKAQGAEERLLDAKFDITTKAAGLVLAGRLTGKNETERDAQKRELLATEYVALSAAEREHRMAMMRLEVCRLEVEQLRMEMRLAELNARKESDMA